MYYIILQVLFTNFFNSKGKSTVPYNLQFLCRSSDLFLFYVSNRENVNFLTMIPTLTSSFYIYTYVIIEADTN